MGRENEEDQGVVCGGVKGRRDEKGDWWWFLWNCWWYLWVVFVDLTGGGRLIVVLVVLGDVNNEGLKIKII